MYTGSHCCRVKDMANPVGFNPQPLYSTERSGSNSTAADTGALVVKCRTRVVYAVGPVGCLCPFAGRLILVRSQFRVWQKRAGFSATGCKCFILSDQRVKWLEIHDAS